MLASFNLFIISIFYLLAWRSFIQLPLSSFALSVLLLTIITHSLLQSISITSSFSFSLPFPSLLLSPSPSILLSLSIPLPSPSLPLHMSLSPSLSSLLLSPSPSPTGSTQALSNLIIERFVSYRVLWRFMDAGQNLLVHLLAKTYLISCINNCIINNLIN